MAETWDFGVLVQAIGAGELRQEMSEEVKKVVTELHNRAFEGSKKMTGTINLKMDIKVTPKGLVVWDYDISSRMQKKVRNDTPLFLGRNGMSEDNPKQIKLNLKEVPRKRELAGEEEGNGTDE